MITLTRRHVYKNGGASYARDGIKASIYCGPKMFSGDKVDVGGVLTAAPASLEIDAPNLATPGAVPTESAEKRAAKKAELQAQREAKKAERAAKKATAEEKRAAFKSKKEARQAEREAKIAARRAAANPPAAPTTGDQASA
jgi:uncharacterized protein with WD repeat